MLACAAPAAHAGQATLWGCHGPAGQPLGAAPFVASAGGDGVAGAFGGGCDATAGALGDGGLRAALTRPDPATGSAARWQAELPPGLTVSQLRLVRRTSGFGGTPVPGGAQSYLAETAAGPLESSSVQDASNVPLDGVATFATGQDRVRFGVGCGAPAPASGRCAAPSAAPIAVEVGAVAVTVTDADAPRGAVGGLTSPASGTLVLSLRATDVGTGLARAEARVDGSLVASADLGGAGCADLSPADPAVDLPLGGGCPATVDDASLSFSTGAFGDGVHQLQVSVGDATGNRTLVADQPFVVRNTPLGAQASAVATIGTGAAGAPGAPGSLPGAGGAVPAGGAAIGSGPSCLAPRLSMFLRQRPLRVAGGVPVVRKNARYRYSGSLSCLVAGRRVHARSGVVVSLLNQIGRRTYLKSGVATRSDGGVTIIVAYPSSRVLEFRYTSADRTTARVRIRITVARAAAKRPAPKRRAR